MSDSYRYLMKLQYKGTNFHGWQRQPNAVSVQSVLEENLSKIARQNIGIVGCGRTDTGVHASDYYLHFDSATKLDAEQLKYKLNKMCGDAIGISDFYQCSPEFHARFGALARTYYYFIHDQKAPFLSDRSWYRPYKLDIEAMNEAANILLEFEDFECFSKVNTDVNHFLCRIDKAEWTELENGWRFEIKADRFLRNMVRAIVGTLVDIGSGKSNIDEFRQIIESKSRSKAGTSAPPQGLFLAKIDYPEELLQRL